MATISATNDATLTTAFNNAVAGDVIELSDAQFSKLSLSGKDYGAGISVVSADVANKARLLGMALSSCVGISFANIELPYTKSGGDVETTIHIDALNSDNINFDYCDIVGADDPATSSGTGVGIYVNASTNCDITNCLLSGFFLGS